MEDINRGDRVTDLIYDKCGRPMVLRVYCENCGREMVDKKGVLGRSMRVGATPSGRPPNR